MRNTYKYTKMYSGAEPQFVEGDVFRNSIPLAEMATATVGPHFSSSTDCLGNGTVNDIVYDTVNDIVNDTVNISRTERLILTDIRKNPHITINKLSEILTIGKSTVARATKSLKEKSIIARIGSAKTGYWLLRKKG